MVGEELPEEDDSGSSQMEADIVTMSTKMPSVTKPASIYQSSAALYWSSSSEDSNPVDADAGPGWSQSVREGGSGEELTIHNVFEVSATEGFGVVCDFLLLVLLSYSFVALCLLFAFFPLMKQLSVVVF